jgi:hypothetical protein
MDGRGDAPSGGLTAQGRCRKHLPVLLVARILDRSDGPDPLAQEFTGLRLGITSPGPSTDFLTQALATRNDVATEDFTRVKAGAGKPTVQKLANAFVKTLAFIHTHSAGQIAAKMPTDYAGSDPTLYATAIADSKSMFTRGRRHARGRGERRPRRAQLVLAQPAGQRGQGRPGQDLHHRVRRGRQGELSGPAGWPPASPGTITGCTSQGVA